MIILTDLETTGLNPYKHEILEIGAIVIDEYDNFTEVDRYITKIAPYSTLDERHQWADPKALEVNGYDPNEWADAPSLSDVMTHYAKISKDCRFMAYNVTFDWGFISKAFDTAHVIDRMKYQRLDLLTLLWAKRCLTDGDKSARLSLKEACIALNVDVEDEVHRAEGGVEAAYRVLRKLYNGNISHSN